MILEYKYLGKELNKSGVFRKLGIPENISYIHTGSIATKKRNEIRKGLLDIQSPLSDVLLVFEDVLWVMDEPEDLKYE